MIIHIKGEKVKLPDFLIVGAARSATTSLYYYLRKHSQIFMSAIKEPYFFSFMNNPPNYVSPIKLDIVKWKIEDYIELFKGAKDNQVIGEASTSYLYTYPTSIENIKRIYGANYKKLKIIIMLRNPVDRAYSQYLVFKRDNVEYLSFKEATKPDMIKKRLGDNWNIYYDYIGFGMYYDQIRAYVEEFPETRIFLYDDLLKNPENLLKDIYAFLNIGFINISGKERYNQSGIPKNKSIHNLLINSIPFVFKPFKKLLPKNIGTKIKYKMFEMNLKKPDSDDKERGCLSSIFEEDIKKTAQLINRDLSIWLAANNRDRQ